jgi:DNA-binding MarR family transcriptional regulator
MPTPTATTTSLGRLEQELTLLARHQLSSGQDPDLHLDRSGYQLLGRLELSPLSLGGLAEAFKLDVSTVNRQVGALRSKGLVERIPDPSGGMAKLLRPTRLGLIQLHQDRKVRYRRVQRIIASWSPSDIERLQQLLAAFNMSIETLEGRPWPRG